MQFMRKNQIESMNLEQRWKAAELSPEDDEDEDEDEDDDSNDRGDDDEDEEDEADEDVPDPLYSRPGTPPLLRPSPTGDHVAA